MLFLLQAAKIEFVGIELQWFVQCVLPKHCKIQQGEEKHNFWLRSAEHIVGIQTSVEIGSIYLAFVGHRLAWRSHAACKHC